MDQDALDQLVDDATHAVNNLIPDAILARLTPDEHSGLLVRINDALTPILSDLIEENV
jgi:hypothetical protein